LLKKQGGLGMDVVYVKIQKTVLDIFDYYGESLHNTQFDMLVNQIETIGYMLNGADLDIFSANAKGGKYKNRVEYIQNKPVTVKFFKLTPDVLTEWLSVYIHERNEAFSGAQNKPKNEVSEVTVKFVEMIKPFIKKTEDTKLGPVPDAPIPVELSKENENQRRAKEIILGIRAEFLELAESQGRENFVEYNGKTLDFDEYLKARIKKTK
jgi:hypothetical protein